MRYLRKGCRKIDRGSSRIKKEDKVVLLLCLTRDKYSRNILKTIFGSVLGFDSLVQELTKFLLRVEFSQLPGEDAPGVRANFVRDTDGDRRVSRQQHHLHPGALRLTVQTGVTMVTITHLG